MIRFSLLLCSLFFLLSARAREVVWLSEPLKLKVGNQEYLNMAIGPETRDLIGSHLPEYRFSSVRANINRTFKQIAESNLACTDAKIRSAERARVSVSSALPQFFLPAYRLYVNKHYVPLVRQHLDAEGKVRLRELLASEVHFRLGTTSSREYSKEINELLSDPRYKFNIWQRTGTDMSLGMIGMLLADRVDMVIEFPLIMGHTLAKLDEQQGFAEFALSGMKDYQEGYILCSKTDDGRRFINKLDSVMKDLTRKPSYIYTQLHWFAPSLWPMLIEYYNRIYGTQFTLEQIQAFKDSPLNTLNMHSH